MGKKLISFAEWRLNENLREYNFYFKKIKKLITSMFVWDNLPDGISQRFIEDKLFEHGQIIFFKSKKLDFYIVSQCTIQGFNHYEEPTEYHAFGLNGVSEYVKSNECIPIWNNQFFEPSLFDVQFFAKRLSNIEKTVDVNLEQMKNPYLVSCPEGQKKTVEQVFMQKTDGVPYIFVNEEFNNMNNIQLLNTNVQNFSRELTEVKHTIENEALTFFGINNVDVLKRERLVTSEAEQNNEQISFNKQSMLYWRKQAVKQINEKFDLNISVSLNNLDGGDYIE